MLDIQIIIISVFGGYLIGSIPFGLVLCLIFGYGDIRKIGSGNIGATNVLRTGNKVLALTTLILDAGKGITAFIIAHLVFGAFDQIAPVDRAFLATITAFAAVLGHMFPVWLKFKGGKGVATSLGALLAALPISGFAACLIWIISAGVTRISSLAALSAFLITPAITYLIYGLNVSLAHVFISALVWWRHKENIIRISQGTEPKIGASKKNKENDDESSSA